MKSCRFSGKPHILWCLGSTNCPYEMKQENNMQSEKEKDGAPGNCWGRKGEYNQNFSKM